MSVIRFGVKAYKPCLVCGVTTKLTEDEIAALHFGDKIDGKICDKCKQAILYVRKQIEGKE